MKNEPTREECIKNLNDLMKRPISDQFKSNLIGMDQFIGSEKGGIGLKWKETFFFFKRIGECDEIIKIFAEFLQSIDKRIALVDIDEVPKAMNTPGPIDQDGFAEITVKDYANNKPYIILSRITRSIDMNKEK